jgi:FkbM family methyltransferase
VSRTPSFYRRYLRPLIPFPRRKTLRLWFPTRAQRNLGVLLKKRGIDLVLDVGANEGQYARMLRAVGFRGRIVSFEPIAEAHEALSKAAAGDPAWEVAPAMALDRKAGERTLFIHRESQLTSLLEHTQDVPEHGEGADVVRMKRVRCETLDGAAAPYLDGARQPFLKLDVQGAERDVLASGGETLARCAGLQIEMSLRPAYKGEPYYLDVLEELRGQGFALAHVMPVTERFAWGEMIQFDAVLFRDDWLKRWDRATGWPGD